MSGESTSLNEHKAATTAAWISLVANVLLMVGKGVIGVQAGSRALFADAVHSAADLAGSVAVMIALRVARKPPDDDHPYGHGKAELVASAVVAILLIVAAIRVGSEGIRALWSTPKEPEAIAGYAAAIAIVIKEVLARYNVRLGRRLNSRSLMASAMDHRSDVISSAAALLGILVSVVGRRLNIHWMMYGDALSSALVAILVLRVGIQVAMDAVHTLMDRAVSEDELCTYHSAVSSVGGVEHIDELRARDHGSYVIVDVKISVNADISVADGHSIAAQVKEYLTTTFPKVHDVLVHVNPYWEDAPNRHDRNEGTQ